MSSTKDKIYNFLHAIAELLPPQIFRQLKWNYYKYSNIKKLTHEDKIFGGFGGEVAAQINDLAFEHLDGPVKRVGSTFTPVGFNRILESAILPDMARIENAANELLNY